MDLQTQVGKQNLRALLGKLRFLALQFPQGKEEALRAFPSVSIFLVKLDSVFSLLSAEERVVCFSLIAIDQFERVCPKADDLLSLRAISSQLLPTEEFYKEMGGIVGYYAEIVSVLLGEENPSLEDEYQVPPVEDLSRGGKEASSAVWEGISHLEQLAELYPVGGAADRLRLVCKGGKNFLPAARLSLAGFSLLSSLVRDVQAREYLFFQLFGRQIEIPLAMMTSDEKENHAQVEAILEENRWFGRGKEGIRLFRQPLVPVVDERGNLVLQGACHLLLKPGGHGVIWKLARETGVLDWFLRLGKQKVLVRQINNPIAGIDTTLLALTGIGFAKQALFGFASCPSFAGMAEGLDVVRLSKVDFTWRVAVTNIEYCDQKKREKLKDPLSYPANTNILFADIVAIKEVSCSYPFPGKLVNFKKTRYRDDRGEEQEEVVGRLETMMQNIAEGLFFEFETKPSQEEIRALPLFLTYNERRKTISTVKRAEEGKKELETPLACFSDLLENSAQLLRGPCSVKLPVWEGNLSAEDPPILFSYHPALGPLYSVIGQKIRGGIWAKGSEVQLEIANLFMKEVSIDGSLSIVATEPLGSFDEKGKLRYTDRGGRCHLENVAIVNRGIDRSLDNCYWENRVYHREMCSITIEEDGEFFAENLTLSGNQQIVVPAGKRVVALLKGGEVCLIEEECKSPSWKWVYEQKNENILLTKKELCKSV